METQPSGTHTEKTTPERIVEPQGSHPADHPLTLQMFGQLQESIGRVDERTRRLEKDFSDLSTTVREINDKMIGKGTWWGGIGAIVGVVGILIATIISLASMYFTRLDAQMALSRPSQGQTVQTAPIKPVSPQN